MGDGLVGGVASPHARNGRIVYEPRPLAQQSTKRWQRWTVVLGAPEGLVPLELRAVITMGAGMRAMHYEADWCRGVVLPAYGQQVIVDVVGGRPLPGLDDEKRYSDLTACIVEGSVETARADVTFTLELGDLVSAQRVAVPAHARAVRWTNDPDLPVFLDILAGDHVLAKERELEAGRTLDLPPAATMLVVTPGPAIPEIQRPGSRLTFILHV